MLQRKVRNILVLDDDHDVTTTFERILRSNGYDVVAFTSSRSAFEYLALFPGKFDLVISDIRMPLMDGIEFARKVKEQLPALRIVLVTAFKMDGRDSARVQSEGIVREVARKPMGIPQLLAIVAKHSRSDREILDSIHCCRKCKSGFLFEADVQDHVQMTGHLDFCDIPFLEP